ncbi:MAG: Rieske 2Fe-2S domain-containing protein [Trueperaceae bacterium]|nr:Rieske 2Fe-2S domain-containing protein [Trueperaceae bacterium]
MSDPDAKELVSEERRKLVTWLWRLPVLAAIGGAGFAGYEFYKHLDKTLPSKTPVFEPKTKIEIAELAELASLWSFAEFSLEYMPAIVFRVPAPVSGGLSFEDKHFIAFSRICTHMGCIVQPNENFEAIAVSYNYRTTSPVLACGCHFSVFAVDKAGEAVSGPATLPIPRVQLELEENRLYAVGLEQKPA